MKSITANPKIVESYITLLGVLYEATQLAIVDAMLHKLKQNRRKYEILNEIKESFREAIIAEKQGIQPQDAKEMLVELVTEIENE